MVTELREVTSQIGELMQQTISTKKQLERVEIKSPVAGIVHEMQVVTIGGVVPPGAVVLQVIPLSNGVEFEVLVDPVTGIAYFRVTLSISRPELDRLGD